MHNQNAIRNAQRHYLSQCHTMFEPAYIGWCAGSGTVTPAESREYREEAASFTGGACKLFPLLVGFMGLEILIGKRPVKRLVKRFVADCGV